ncbi:MAG: hypothetical protein HUU46_13625 [Candidatus Hydrogenedentes bacterium]|nr:hypothetical protein [Candidatus Hydrogenedentota bacterium]
MKRAVVVAVTAALFAGGVVPAWAWGPRTRVAIVSMASRIIARESGANLTKLDKDIRAGASISPSDLTTLVPVAITDPVGAVETEMYLLQAVGGGRVDPYFAYRLGVLGMLVAEVSSPLADADPSVRDVYYADVEGIIEKVQMKPAPRTKVDPVTYFAEVRSDAADRRDLIITDYRSGIGFDGTARSAISDDASRSVNSVADVYQSVLTGRVTSANISPSQIRDYILRAIQFYIKRGNDAETESAYKRLTDLNVSTVDLQKQIGDMFYDAEKYERAMQEYQAVLALDPARRDVTERIAAYYVKLGDDALAEQKLEDAREAYQKALDADKLQPNAQRKLLDAEKLITERDARLEDTRETLTAADEKLNQADQLAFRKDYGGAIALLYEAQSGYGKVTDEFASEYRIAQNGMLMAESKLTQLRRDLVSNAPSLSGLGAGYSTREQAESAAKSLDEQALRALLDRQYEKEIEKIKSEKAGSIIP